MEKVEMFKAKTGEVFATEEEAQKAELTRDVLDLIESNVVYGTELTCNAGELARQIVARFLS